MKKFLLLSLILSSNIFATEIISHDAVRWLLGSIDISLCNVNSGEAVIVSRNPVIVSYTYTLTVGSKTESISFDQDRQTFSFSTDNSTYELIKNNNGENLSNEPKDFLMRLDSKGKLAELVIGKLVCK